MSLQDEIKQTRPFKSHEEETLLKRFKDLGITVIQPDVEAFRRVSAPVAGKFEDAWGKGTYEKMTNAQ